MDSKSFLHFTEDRVPHIHLAIASHVGNMDRLANFETLVKGSLLA